MAILVLVLWAFTAGAGFYLLVTGSPRRAPVRPHPPAEAPPPPPPSLCAAAEPVRLGLARPAAGALPDRLLAAGCP